METGKFEHQLEMLRLFLSRPGWSLQPFTPWRRPSLAGIQVDLDEMSVRFRKMRP